MSQEKIELVMTKIKCGMRAVDACKSEQLAPVKLYQSPEYKAFKADAAPGPAMPEDVPDTGSEEAYIKILRLPQGDDPRAPIFKVLTKYAGEMSVGEHYFISVQAMMAQLPQITFGLTP